MKCKALFAAALTVLLSVFAFTACSAEEYEAASRDFSAEEVKSITVDVTDRAVEFSVSESGGIEIEYYKNSKEDYTFELEEGVLVIRSVFDKDWTDFIGVNGDREKQVLRIAVPDGVLKDLSVRTKNRDIHMEPLSVTGSCVFENNNGDVLFESLDVGVAIDVSTKKGDIVGTVIGSYDEFAIEVSAEHDCNLQNKEGGPKRLKLAANSGSVRVELQPCS